MKNTKKLIALILSLITIVTLAVIPANATKVGTVIGKAQPTDIVATINGYRLLSYNVDGYTYIVAEDLKYYGFKVRYSNSSRALSVKIDDSVTEIEPDNTNPNYGKSANNAQKDILYTDITTYVNNEYVNSYNIDGMTIIKFDELSRFGKVSYDNDKREISLYIKKIAINSESSSAKEAQKSSLKDSVSVTVTKKKNVPEDVQARRYSDRVEFSFKVKNRTSRSIKGIQGVLTVYDLFGEKIISISCDFTGNTIAPNSSITVDNLGIDINQFMDDHVKLYNEKFDDLKFKYEVKDIVYTDSSENKKQTSSDSQASNKVKIEVTNKYNLGKNYDARRYSERVNFSFKITNKGSKAIKGIKGTLIVKDLFGEDIILINCDFTGKTISSGKSVTFDNLGIDINQFMDDHVKLYNEKFDDLKFEYDVKSIVFTDGSTDDYE